MNKSTTAKPHSLSVLSVSCVFNYKATIFQLFTPATKTNNRHVPKLSPSQSESAFNCTALLGEPKQNIYPLFTLIAPKTRPRNR